MDTDDKTIKPMIDGNLEEVKKIVTKENVNSPISSDLPLTPLMYAIILNKKDIVEYLLELEGTDINTEINDSEGNSKKAINFVDNYLQKNIAKIIHERLLNQN